MIVDVRFANGSAARDTRGRVLDRFENLCELLWRHDFFQGLRPVHIAQLANPAAELSGLLPSKILICGHAVEIAVVVANHEDSWFQRTQDQLQ